MLNLAFFKAEDAQYFSKILKEDETELSINKMREHKICNFFLKLRMALHLFAKWHSDGSPTRLANLVLVLCLIRFLHFSWSAHWRIKSPIFLSKSLAEYYTSLMTLSIHIKA
jgi:hypothetical protein